MDISEYSESSRLFYVRRMDWGFSNRHKPDEIWLVFADGTVKSERDFMFRFENPLRPDRFTDEEFKTFCELLDDFDTAEDNRDGCDGTGYEMVLFGPNGRPIHSFNGYIHRYPFLIKIVEYLKKF